MSSPGVDGGRGGVDHPAEEEDGVGRTVPDAEEEGPVGGERRRGGYRLTEAAAATGSLGEAEIGRASCRERVCLYV